jgi:hypothetical protein
MTQLNLAPNMRRSVFLGVAFVIGCSPAEKAEPAGEPPAPATVTLDQFRQIHWIAGDWRGSGGAYPSFFEQYRIVDDSTIQMRALSDSTFTVATDSSWIELRHGTVRGRGNDQGYVVIALAADSIRFVRPGASTGGHTFTRASADEWTATLHAASAGGQPTVYVMRRIPR